MAKGQSRTDGQAGSSLTSTLMYNGQHIYFGSSTFESNQSINTKQHKQQLDDICFQQR